MNPITAIDRLNAIRELLNSDTAYSADCEAHGMGKTEPKEMAELISAIYKIAHPSEDCPHEDWDADTAKFLMKPETPKQ